MEGSKARICQHGQGLGRGPLRHLTFLLWLLLNGARAIEPDAIHLAQGVRFPSVVH